MSKKYLLLVAVFVFGLATTAQADFVYDFNAPTYTTGSKLATQDGWFKLSDATNLWYVGGTTAGWDGYYADSSTNTGGTARHNITLGLQDNVSFDMSAEFRADDLVYKCYAQYYYDNGTTTYNYLSMGITSRTEGSGLYWVWSQLKASGGPIVLNWTFADSPTEDSRVLLGLAFTAQGNDSWSVQPYYQVNGGTVQNAGSPVTVNDFQPGTMASNWNRVQLINSTAGSRIDNLVCRTIPEPSTLALLGCGLVGLLAYAWRKRK